MRAEGVLLDIFGQIRSGFVGHDHFLVRVALGNTTNHEKLSPPHGEGAGMAHHRQKGNRVLALKPVLPAVPLCGPRALSSKTQRCIVVV